MRKHLSPKAIGFFRWIKHGPVKGLYALTLMIFPQLGTFRRFIMHYWLLGVWIKSAPYKHHIGIDVGALPTQERFRRDFLASLLNIINRPERKKGPLHISVLLPPNLLGAMADIQAMVTCVPKNNLGDLEFFFSAEDMNSFYDRATANRYKIEALDPKIIDFNDTQGFQKLSRRLCPPAVYENWARNYLKSFGSERFIYFCDLSGPFE